MKIDSSKANETEKRIDARDKPDANFRSPFNPAERLMSPPPTGGFAKVLEQTRKENAKDKDSPSGQKTDRAGQSSETAEAKKDDETGTNVLNRDKAEEKNEPRDGDQNQKDQSDEPDKNSAFALAGFQSAIKSAPEISVPAARSILHVADLERIVSLIRSQNLKNAEQVVISLKHSVLEGLQIKLTIEENGTLKAEFLALNEQIKNQLNARKPEIAQIFRERGVKLSDLDVRQGSEFEPPANHRENNAALGETSHVESDVSATKTDAAGNQTSYRV